MRIDLHTHSNVSDGTDRPDALVRNAADAGLDVVALTDHDTFDGCAAAASAATEAGITLIAGVEMSTSLHGMGVHVLGYLPDPDDPRLGDELALIRGDREHRVQAMVDRLATLGLDITVADVLAAAGYAVTLGRPHVADALVAKGYVRDRRDAFTKYLAAGGPAYVHRYAPGTAEAVRFIRDAGGVPVLAHPWGRASRAVLDVATIRKLADAGLGGLEVDHVDHDPEARAELREVARELDLMVTGSSDYHGTGKTGHDLGIHTTAADQYERLIAQAVR